MSVLERFLNYVKFETTSDEESPTCPSTKGQMVFAKFLVEELKNIGIQDASVDENGYVTATIPANTDQKIPTVGFIAHMDTSSAVSGKDVQARIVKYDGGDIILNEKLNIVLSPKEFPELNEYLNEELVVTDGTTLLGADDKAGVAEIIEAAERILNNPDLKHGTIKIGFTPDEEIGRGADLFDVKKFNADFAYTCDGSTLGELQYETFNAAGAKIEIKGTSVHPGSAKNKMVNAASIAAEFAELFPKKETPEETEGYEGFYHLTSISGTAEEAHLSYIIRDFDKVRFEKRKAHLKDLAEKVNEKYHKEIVFIEIKDQYYNMKEKIEGAFYIVDIAKKAMKDLSITPKIIPVRGGTDGSRLSYMGLLTPNLFTGGANFHGKYEYISVPAMEKAVGVLVKIVENIAQ